MSSIPPVHTIPQEVYGTILSNLGTTDTKNCALVCKQWTAEAHRSLGTFPLITSAESAAALKSHLRRAPENRERVKGLWLRANANSINDQHPWMRTALVELAPLLPNLASLTIQDWRAVETGPEVVAALRSLTKVTKLALRGCNFRQLAGFDDFMLSLPALSHLRLDALGWTEYSLSTLDRLQVVPLTKLEIYGFATDPLLLLFWFKSHRCRPSEFAIHHGTRESLEAIDYYLKYLGDKLEVYTLSLRLNPLRRPLANGQREPRVKVNLLHNPSVRSLTLWTNGSPQGPQNAWLPRLLRSARKCPLQQITFEMNLDDENALESDIWESTAYVLNHSWRQTLQQVTFVHHPIRDESTGIRPTISPPDATAALERRFKDKARGIHVPIIRVMNAPVIDLGRPDEDD